MSTPNPSHALISGGASGIGLAVSQALLALGTRVSVLDLQLDGTTALQRRYPEHLQLFQCDVSDFKAVAHCVEQATTQFGTIDKLVCAAGRLQMGKATELHPEQWRHTFAVNTDGVFNLCHLVAKQMQEHRHGAIVAISSNAATTPRSAMSAYAASKAAVTQFARCLGLELAEYGVRVNIVSPGSTDTPMQQAMWQQGSSAETVIQGSLAQYRLGIPLRKIATPEEVADAVLFLLSEQASHISLHDLRVDGGATLDQ